MNLTKGHLSRFLGTRCERSLYLSLHDREELDARNLPKPLASRPQVRHLHGAGIELEEECIRRLRSAFPDMSVRNERDDDSTGDSIPLHDALAHLQGGTVFIIQPKFDLEDDRVRFLTSLGVAESDQGRIPPLGSHIPDIIAVDAGSIGKIDSPEYAVTPEGDRISVDPGDGRRRLNVIDIKHAREANAGYESEVALYAVALSSWLRARGFDGQYLVSSAISLWTSGGVAEGKFAAAAADEKATTEQRLNALRSELAVINAPIYLQAIRRFMAEQLPAVIALGDTDFDALEWHVCSRCGSCDWLGHGDWLSKEDRERIAQDPGGYCLSKARDSDHLSRVPMITRGARSELERNGVHTVRTLAAQSGDEAVFGRHTGLKRDRRALPAYAKAIATGSSFVDRNRVDGGLARNADLDVFVSVDFDAGAGQLTGIGIEARFRQRTPRPRASGESRTWRKQWIVDRKSQECEGHRVCAFLDYLAGIYEWVRDTDPEKGGPHADDTSAQLIFWHRRQHRELCLAVGRHLPAILYADQDLTIRALVWLFPPPEIHPRDAVDPRRPSAAFIRDIVRRLVRVPALHELTLFNVTEHYRWGKQLRTPNALYREPLSDAIPRERIYEIWAASAAGPGSKVRRGSKEYGLAALKASFRRTLRTRTEGLRMIVWQLRRDVGDRFRAKAPRLHWTVPDWTEGVAYDSKLWIAWCSLSKAFDDLMTEAAYLDDPEELEARYEGLRLTNLLEEHSDGSLEFAVSQDSRDAKFRTPESFLALALDDTPGFLNRRIGEVVGVDHLPESLRKFSNRRLSTVFKVKLLEFNREELRARIAWDNFWYDDRALQGAVWRALGERARRNLTLMGAAGPGVRVTRLFRTLNAIGDPAIACPSAETLAALGNSGAQVAVGHSPMTPAAAVLWDAERLHDERARSPECAAAIANAAVRTSTPPLDDSQRGAIASAVSRRLSVIWGPPGTGKTRTCAAMVHQLANHEARRDSEQAYNILLTGPNYRAVGELAERVMRRMSVDESADATLFVVYREGRKDEFLVPSESVDGFEIRRTTATRRNPAFAEMMDMLTDGTGVNIVAAVVHQCPRISEQAARLDDAVIRPLFDFMLYDESSQADMSIAIPPLALLRDGFQLVLAGDLLQMPPISQCDPPIGAEHLVGSIQRYFVERFRIAQEKLLRNYRSADEIVRYTKGLGYPEDLQAAFPNARLSHLSDPAAFGNALEAAGLAQSDGWRAALDPEKRIVAITYGDGVCGQANPFEAECVASLVFLLRKTVSAKLADHNGEGDEGTYDDDRFWRVGVGVVTPHRAQRAVVVRRLRRLFPCVHGALIEGAVDTVERFQGGERHTIIVSFGVGDPDLIAGEEKFLMQLERTNVAMSRAMAKCIVLLSEEVAGHIPADRNAIETAHALKGVVDEWCKDKCQTDVLSPLHGRRRIVVRSRPAPPDWMTPKGSSPVGGEILR